MWESPERYSLAERGDAISKFLDVPFRSKMELIGGFSPAEIDQMEVEKAAETLMANLMQPATPTTTTPAAAPVDNTQPTPNAGVTDGQTTA
jgi:hypothetical protein